MDGREVVLGRSVSSPPHLDTVRALHQTVVSLRTALELSKNELKQLREKYQQHSQSNYEDAIEKLTLENHILRRKIIDTHSDDTFDLGDVRALEDIDVKSESTDRTLNQIEKHISKRNNTGSPINFGDETVIESSLESEQVILEVTEEIYDEKIATTETVRETSESSDIFFCTAENLNTGRNQSEAHSESEHVQEPIPSEKLESIRETFEESERSNSTNELLLSQRKENDRKSFKTKIELHSKFDVSIKVRTLEGDENFVSTTTSETESNTDVGAKETTKIHREEKFTEKFTLRPASQQQGNMAVPHGGSGGGAEPAHASGEYAVNVRVISEESLLVESERRPADTLNLDVDGLSVRSMSEGDNSVFSEEVEGGGGREGGAGCGGYEGEDGSNDDEEVDDIELIFTTDESKDMSNLQEDLVSIRESEPWVPSSPAKSTPILIKFQTLDPDLQSEGSPYVDGGKRVSLPGDPSLNGRGHERPGILRGCDVKSDNCLNKTGRRLASMDSLSCERGLSFDTKSSSFELGSSLDLLTRDNGDGYPRRLSAHRYSVLAETDISKCGISEEELAGANLNARRNTCPNPFQYRPLPLRAPARQSGPFKARSRPVLREAGGVRRERGAQTDVSALPSRWSSDGYLAHKRPCAPPATLPGRAPAPRRRPAPPALRAAPHPPAAPRTGEARRVLLSDIGFTSMVPELSRSADPVWAEGAACGACGSTLRSPAASPTRLSAANTSRYLARSVARSPRRSSERGYDFSCGYVPALAAASPIERRGAWRSSLPDVRGGGGGCWGVGGGAGGGVGGSTFGRTDTDDLLDETDAFLRRSIDNLRPDNLSEEGGGGGCGAVRGGLSRPYIPAEPRHLRLGHTVKIITPNGRIAIGTVRYVGVAGGTGEVHVGATLTTHGACLPHNDGTLAGRRYFRTPPGHTAIFVPFSKVVMAWAN